MLIFQFDIHKNDKHTKNDHKHICFLSFNLLVKLRLIRRINSEKSKNCMLALVGFQVYSLYFIVHLFSAFGNLYKIDTDCRQNS